MAIIYSYPHASPAINDMVLGAKFKENDGVSTNSFYIYDLINLMQTTTVTYEGLEAFTTNSLNATYPNAMIGFKVQGVNPGLLAMYEKTDLNTWISYPITLV